MERQRSSFLGTVLEGSLAGLAALSLLILSACALGSSTAQVPTPSVTRSRPHATATGKPSSTKSIRQHATSTATRATARVTATTSVKHSTPTPTIPVFEVVATPTPTTPTPTVPPPPTPHYYETAGPGGSGTFTNYSNAGGTLGSRVPAYGTVEVSCRLTGWKAPDGDNWWYRIASSPWNNTFYASADNYYNNGQTSGSLAGTPFVDTNVPLC